ncbi:hypothetical protein LTS18_011053 [Coniosporium uncinatum]|uniref:Uncharacterized protein n=1 Tax=Coniosporium uncinatum TaxID=93489 RepID=A0ACC3DCC4_9PEZI|nr:hypothetical protein LTS18_011053 [Coniosporium uncinatum]
MTHSKQDRYFRHFDSGIGLSFDERDHDDSASSSDSDFDDAVGTQDKIRSVLEKLAAYDAGHLSGARTSGAVDNEAEREAEPLSFFDLPANVRILVYSYALTSDIPISCPIFTSPYTFVDSLRRDCVSPGLIIIPRPALGVNILRTCRRIYHEATHVLYQDNHFVAHLGHHRKVLEILEHGKLEVRNIRHGGRDICVKGFYTTVRAMTATCLPAWISTLTDTSGAKHSATRNTTFVAHYGRFMTFPSLESSSSRSYLSLIAMSHTTLGIAITVRDMHSAGGYNLEWIPIQISRAAVDWDRALPWVPSHCCVDLSPFRDQPQALPSLAASSLPGSLWVSPTTLSIALGYPLMLQGQAHDRHQLLVADEGRVKDKLLTRWMWR